MSEADHRSMRAVLSPRPGVVDSTALPQVELTHPQLVQQVRDVETTVNQLLRKCRQLQATQDRQRAIVDDLRGHVFRMEELFSRSQTDLIYAQQQLEFVVVGLEREHGIVADHTEQLRLFAGESHTRGFSDGYKTDQQPLLVIANWLYTPVVYFAKGVYTILSPVINTAQSLSLFNSEVLNRSSENELRTRWIDAKHGDLLNMLQRGLLDPNSPASRKAGSVAH